MNVFFKIIFVCGCFIGCTIDAVKSPYISDAKLIYTFTDPKKNKYTVCNRDYSASCVAINKNDDIEVKMDITYTADPITTFLYMLGCRILGNKKPVFAKSMHEKINTRRVQSNAISNARFVSTDKTQSFANDKDIDLCMCSRRVQGYDKKLYKFALGQQTVMQGISIPGGVRAKTRHYLYKIEDHRDENSYRFVLVKLACLNDFVYNIDRAFFSYNGRKIFITTKDGELYGIDIINYVVELFYLFNNYYDIQLNYAEN